MALGSLDNTPVKGWLGNFFGKISGSFAGRGVAGGYDYGYPAGLGGGVESNVAAQWIFDEASGNIVDEVAGLTLTQANSPTYGIDSSAYSNKMEKSIKTRQANAGNFRKTTATPSLDIGTSDFVIEAVFKHDSQQFGSSDGFLCCANTTKTSGWQVGVADNGVGVQIWAEDGTYTSILKNVDGGSFIGDGLYHKIRIVGDRSGSLEVFFDGVSYGTSSIVGLAAKSYLAYQTHVAGRASDGYCLLTINFDEIRVTIGNATNNSSGPNGG